jgi:DNA polymerase (family 10)
LGRLENLPYIAMTNQEIAAVFRRLADLLELRDENPFKIRSYRAAAETIEETTTPLVDLVAAGGLAKLRELPGIGEAISKKIVELAETGTFRLYEEVKAELPPSILDLLKIDGIGLKTLQLLFRQFHITNLEDFTKFVEGGGLNSVPRLSDKAKLRIKEQLAVGS